MLFAFYSIHPNGKTQVNRIPFFPPIVDTKRRARNGNRETRTDREKRRAGTDLTVLVETDVLSLLTEALTADVHPVLADETTAVRADTASTGSLAVLAGPAVPHGLVSHLEKSEARKRPE